MKTYLTFDDVLIAPKFSTIESREDIKTDQEFLGSQLSIPIISSNMDFVTGSRMAIAMWEAGGLGIIHRFCPWEAQIDNIQKLYASNIPITLSVGTRDPEQALFRISKADYYIAPKIVCVDVAHGHHTKVASLIQQIKYEFSDWKIIAGNVATAEGAYFLAEAGADAIKVGIGPGSVCTTRIVTGVGVPQLSAIMEVADALKPYAVKIIADGGIKNSGDIVKALGAGAHVVMLGNLLAGASECPGEVIETGDGRRLRRYRGQSIFGVNGDRYVKEGVSGYVEEKGPVEGILKQLVGGLRSGMSYVGARYLYELKDKTEFIQITPNALLENGPRINTGF